MKVLIMYDVKTDDGGKTLDKIRKTCEKHGIHIQNSVFLVDMTLRDIEALKDKLLLEGGDRLDLKIYKCEVLFETSEKLDVINGVLFF